MSESPLLDPSRVVTVRVPATSANLGPGFDTLGMALTFYNTFTFRFSPDERHHIVGIGDTEAILSVEDYEDSLILKAAARIVGKLPPLTIVIDAPIPMQRGLGSSASAVVAGILGIKELLSLKIDSAQMLSMAAQLEGHADNAAAAFFGGIQCVVVRKDGFVERQAVPVAPALLERLVIVACIPALRMGTDSSRNTLPTVVPFASAVFTAGRTALQVMAWGSGDVEVLRCGFEDRLHQPYRLTSIPGAFPAFEQALAQGAYGSTLSGSGSTLLSFCPDRKTAQRVGGEMREALRRQGTAVEAVHLLQIDTVGATVQVASDPV